MNPTIIPLSHHTAGRKCRAGFSILGVSPVWHALRMFFVYAMLGLSLALEGAGVKTFFACYAGSKSDYLELKLLDHVLGGGDYTRPGTVYFALFSAAPSDSGGGTELSGNNYSRTAITNNPTNFPSASAGAKTNGTQINGPVFSGTTATVVAWGLFDASSSGNLLYWGDLAGGDQKSYAANDQPIIPVSSLTITED